MLPVQTGILADVPACARYLSFSLIPDSDYRAALQELAAHADGSATVVGLGRSLIESVDGTLTGLGDFPSYSRKGVEIPSTPAALWCWLRGEERGELVHRTKSLQYLVGSALQLDQVIDAFRYGTGRDLTGYEDGTENPDGDDAIKAAVVTDTRPGMMGSSFVAVQQWVHDLASFQAMPQQEQDHTIGRRISDNEEIDHAPDSAHVKRTAQEDFTPEAFILRRSMPWADAHREGLVFTAFGYSTAAYAAILHRMSGAEDGIVDALFRFTRPLTGGYFWCPPMRGNQLDLRALGL